jgi:uncharacterized protein HemX
MSDLARARLVLSARRGGGGRLVAGLLVVAALLAGAGASHLYWRRQLAPLQQQAAALKDLAGLRQGLEQARLMQRLADGRSQELERQVDALNQRLRECQEELTFFRKAHDGKH